jgi:hypothetical protein
VIPTYNELFRFLIAMRSSETQEIIFGIDCLKTGFSWIAMTPSAIEFQITEDHQQRKS